MTSLTCFKAYDIRGRIPDELNEEIAWRIGRAYAQFLQPRRVVVGRDVRLTSEGLCQALSAGLMEGGADVSDLGLCGTEEVYFAAFSQPVDGGIMVTASHNPMDYNGMKLVRQGARPISGDSGLQAVRGLTEAGEFAPAARRGESSPLDLRADYVRHLLTYIDPGALRPLKVVVNAGNGCAGPVIDALAPWLPFDLVRVHHAPEGTFPNGIPNPLLPENRAATSEAVLESGADLGVAWDGDFDRCFLFDEQGNFIEGYYIVGLLAEVILQAHPGAKIIHDPRLTWNTVEVVKGAGGIPVQSKTGHAFIKERMRAENAVYGGEMSAHHYFRDFSCCDSGMIPWLMVTALMSRSGKPLSTLIDEAQRRFPASGEINRTLADPARAMAEVERRFAPGALTLDRTDGLSLEFADWRFNLRSSNTEPVLRLNIEARGDEELMCRMTRAVLAVLDRF